MATQNIGYVGQVPPNAVGPEPPSFKPFESSNVVSGSKEFLESNSWIAKLAFLLFVIIVFIILLRLSITLLSWIFSPKGTVVLINGLVSGNIQSIISQDPNNKGSTPILRSVNEQDGIEFTWSTWIFLNSIDNSSGYKHVFNKGNMAVDKHGIVSPNNAPGLYITPGYRGLYIVMNTFESPTDEHILIEDIPIQKWINVIIKVQNKNFDVYINGRLTKRRVLNNVVKQNYDNVNVSLNGGFNGYLSQLTYYNRAIGVAQIQDIVYNGPNLKSSNDALVNNKPRYLAERWYFDQNQY